MVIAIRRTQESYTSFPMKKIIFLQKIAKLKDKERKTTKYS